MIGLDTNVLARYYIDDASDVEAQKQREAAKKLIESDQPLQICKTVLLEFEWVLRGYYGFTPKQIAAVIEHLAAQPHIDLEDRETIDRARSYLAVGLDFADALHLASYADCTSVASFDERKFARRAQRAGLAPKVVVLG